MYSGDDLVTFAETSSELIKSLMDKVRMPNGSRRAARLKKRNRSGKLRLARDRFQRQTHCPPTAENSSPADVDQFNFTYTDVARHNSNEVVTGNPADMSHDSIMQLPLDYFIKHLYVAEELYAENLLPSLTLGHANDDESFSFVDSVSLTALT